MATLINEDFEGYPIGSVVSTLPWHTAPFGAGIIKTPGINPTPGRSVGSSPGFFFNLWQYTAPTAVAGTFVHIFYSFTLAGSSGGNSIGQDMLHTSNIDPNNDNFPPLIFACGIDGNYGISLRTQNGYLNDMSTGVPANSVIQYNVSISYVPWYFLQLDLNFFPVTQSNGAETIGIAASCLLDGQVICSGSGDTGVPYKDPLGNPLTFTTFCDINKFQFFGPATGGLVDNITVNVDDNPTGTNPHITKPNPTPPPTDLPVIPNARLSQAVLEYTRLETGASPRMSQAVIEYVKQPTNGNVRLSQAVIELVCIGGSNPTGWQVKEI